ncbi:2-oxoacid:acceptor oxidoreductase family protein [Akkermansia muciniphila]|uniref:2-oxoacid:acceptor oxidoreductase family protein n=1 Tax=Akkermansia muciniphila TaxID=239935 RepID=UPI001F016E27
MDAEGISEDALGRNLPNTPMLGAIVKIINIMDKDFFLENMKGSFKHKFAHKPEVIDGNMKALARAMEEVRKYER